jgi:hypothetical protein
MIITVPGRTANPWWVWATVTARCKDTFDALLQGLQRHVS